MDKLLEQMFAMMQRMDNEITTIKQTIVTKQDLEQFATKQDLEQFATKQDLQGIHRKLDSIAEQVAQNSEQIAKIDELSSRVDRVETDVQLLKKIVVTP